MALESNKIPIAVQYDGNGNITGFRQAPDITVSSMSVSDVTVTNLSALNSISATNFQAANFTVEELTVTTLNAANLSFTDLIVTGLTAITINAASQIVAPNFSATTFTVDTFSPQSLIVTSLSAYDSVSAGAIRSPDISATTFAADSFNPTTLQATYISATNSVSAAQIRSPDISGTTVNATQIRSPDISGTTLNVVTFSPQSLIVTSLSAYTSISGASIKSPSANIGTISGLNSGSVTLASNLDAGGNIIGATYLQTLNIQYKGAIPEGGGINVGSDLFLGAYSLSGTGVSAGAGKFPSLTGTTLNSTNATLTNVTGTAATITTVNGTNSNFTNVTGTNLNSTTANITTLTAASVTGTTLNSTNATLTNVTGTTAAITTIGGTNLNYTNVTGTTLNSTNATLTNVTGTTATITTIGGTNSNYTNVTGTTFNSTNANITNLTGTTATIPTFNATLVKSTSVSSLNLSAFNVTGQSFSTWQISLAQPTSVGGFSSPYSSNIVVSSPVYFGNRFTSVSPTSFAAQGSDLIGIKNLDCLNVAIGYGIFFPARYLPGIPLAVTGGNNIPTSENGFFDATGGSLPQYTYLTVTSVTGGGVTSPDTLIFHGGTNQENYVISRILYSVTGIAPVLSVDSPTESEVFSTYNQNTLHSTFLAYNDLKYAVTGNLSMIGNITSNGIITSPQVSSTSGTFENLFFRNASSNGGFISQVSGLTPTNSTNLATKGYVDTVSGTHIHDLATTSIIGTLPITKGGTNSTTFSDYGVIYYESGGGGVLVDTGTGIDNSVLVSNGAAPGFSNQITVTGITATSGTFTTAKSASISGTNITGINIYGTTISGTTIAGVSGLLTNIKVTSLSSNGGFTTTVSGLTPTSSTHLTPKSYVDAKTWSLTGSVTDVLPVANGGTNSASFTDYGVLYKSLAVPATILSTAAGAAGQVFVGSAAAPAWSSTPTVTTLNATNVTATTTLVFGDASATGGFKTVVSGLTPTASTHLVTKNYVDSAAVSANNIWTTKGDIVVATAANTASRLSVSSNNLVLAADSSVSQGISYKATNIRLFNSFDAAEINSSTAESSALSFSIPAATMGSSDVVELTIEGYLYNNTTKTVVYTGRAFWGGVCIWGDVFGVATATVKKPIWITVRVNNLGSVSKQRVSGYIDCHNGAAAGSVTGIGNWGQTDPAMTFMSNGYPTVNTTSTASVLTFSLQMDTNSASAAFKYDIVTVDLKKGIV